MVAQPGTCYWSANHARVLETTGQKPVTHLLKKQQLLLYGRVARQRDDEMMRSATFCPGSLRPAVDMFVRKIGRPRLDWTSEVGKLALQAAGGMQQLQKKLADEREWRSVVESF